MIAIPIPKNELSLSKTPNEVDHLSHLKGIAFESPEVQLQRRERLRQMSDEELVKFGKMVRGLTEPRVSVMLDTWKEQLQEAVRNGGAGTRKRTDIGARASSRRWTSRHYLSEVDWCLEHTHGM